MAGGIFGFPLNTVARDGSTSDKANIRPNQSQRVRFRGSLNGQFGFPTEKPS